MDIWSKLCLTGLVFTVVTGFFSFIFGDIGKDRGFAFSIVLFMLSLALFVASGLGKILAWIWF